MQNIETLVNKCKRLDEELDARYTTFQDFLDETTGKSRKAITEENIVGSLDIIDEYRHKYNATLKEEKKFLQSLEALHKKVYKVVKRYYVKKSGDSKTFIEAHPEYGFDADDDDLKHIIDSRDIETYIQANDDYIAVARALGNQLSFCKVIQQEIDSLSDRSYRLQQAAKHIRYEQGNFT